MGKECGSIQKLNKDLGIVVVLNCDYEILKKRIVGRYLCKDCGSIYNTLTGVNTPKQEGICDACGAELVQRNDDTEEIAKNRFDTYFKQTAPLIDFYEDRKILTKIDATGSVDEIYETLKSVI